jgi:hypothetical protein
MPEITIETVEELRNAGYSVSVACTKCKYNGPTLDLEKFIRQGRGGMRPIELGLRHESCKAPLQLTIHAAKGYGK